MKEIPIIFSGPMVRAIMSGSKSQTRRVLNPQPHFDEKFGFWRWHGGAWPHGSPILVPGHSMYERQRYKPGDRLWVQEAAWYAPNRVAYAADNESVPRGYIVEGFGRKKPAIHMPRWASRIALKVADVNVERLHDISDQDVIAEGICHFYGSLDKGAGLPKDIEDQIAVVRLSYGSLQKAYSHQWETLHGKNSWEKNPWVAAVTFERAQS